MLVRVYWHRRRAGGVARFQNLALATAALLTPSALVAFTIFFWSVAAEFHWTSNFFVSTGLFSHWQMWLFIAGAFLGLARLLNRYAEGRKHLPQ